MCITDRHDMTIAVKVALNPNTLPTNQIDKLHIQQNIISFYLVFLIPWNTIVYDQT